MSEPIPLDVAERAMYWHFELQELNVSEATLAAWMHWRQAHPAHEQAWLRAEAFTQRMSDIRNAGQQSLAHAALRPALSRRRALKQLAVLLAAGSGAWGLKDTPLVQDWQADYHSRIGEQRRLVLADNTQVQLNTDSAINVAFTQDARRLELLRGELLITRDKRVDGTVLSVETAQGRLEAALVQFSVRQHAGLTQVSVYQGLLAVNPAWQTRAPITLNAGEQATFSGQSVIARRPVGLAPPAWAQGMLVSQGQPLAAFLDELSRYRRGHLACDPGVAQLRVSGTFPLADTEKIIFAVADTLQLDVQQFTRYWVTLKSRQA